MAKSAIVTRQLIPVAIILLSQFPRADTAWRYPPCWWLLHMHLADLKAKSPADLLALAESLQIENASSLRKQDMMFAILKNLADHDQAIYGEGTLEILPD